MMESSSILSAPILDSLHQVEGVARLRGVAPPEGVGGLLLLWRANHSDERKQNLKYSQISSYRPDHSAMNCGEEEDHHEGHHQHGSHHSSGQILSTPGLGRQTSDINDGVETWREQECLETDCRLREHSQVCSPLLSIYIHLHPPDLSGVKKWKNII